MNLFATCPKSLEGLLEEELKTLGAITTKQTTAGVYFTGTLEIAYRICLWSRLASRVLLHLQTLPVTDPEGLYTHMKQFPWEDHCPKDEPLWIDFIGESSTIRNSHFGALKAKDAIVDRLREHAGWRPNIDRDWAAVRLNLLMDRDQILVNLDLSGASLHQRGYRTNSGPAPLKENLASALLLRAGWPEIAKEGGACIDPLCGSGTFLIEAGLMALDIAPGLLRQHFGFTKWLGHDRAIWKTLKDDAMERRAVGLSKDIEIRGYDADPRSIVAARLNVERAGLEEHIAVSVKELAQFIKPTHKPLEKGLVITNPPYGLRLGEVESLKSLYQHLGERLCTYFEGWHAAIFTGNPELGKLMPIRTKKYYQFFNGTVACRLLLFDITSEWMIQRCVEGELPVVAKDETVSDQAVVAKEFTPGALMFANRLKKNLAEVQKWATREHVECYRIYDADMPEYAVALDRYGDWLHVQEYAPPKSIDPVKADQRLNEVLSVLPDVLSMDPEKIVVKQRKRQKGAEQYTRFSEVHREITVHEQGCRFYLNLTDYIDTGLFLDHRPLRMMIQNMAKNQRFLNLFCYTGSATVHAAKGGARSSTSVDLSATYLKWARRNLSLNGFSDSLHRLIQADCLVWLQEQTEQYDLILLDPPTFSNSKRMQGVLDIDRDHPELIRCAMHLLAPGGTLFFSTNYQKFKLDERLKDDFLVENITRKTIPFDFKRQTKIHQVYKIQHLTDQQEED